MLMIELGKIAPDDLFSIVHAEWMGDAFAFFDEPLGMLFEQSGIVGAMIDDQIDDHAESETLGLAHDLAQLFLRRFGRAGIQQPRIDLKIVFDGIKAAGASELLNGIYEDPVESHICRSFQMRLPSS